MTKTELLSGLREEYRQWEALLEEIGPERMEQPGASGDWSIRDVVAHLTDWRRRTVGRLQAAGRGEPEPPPPWPAGMDNDDEINAWFHESGRGRSVAQVLAESDQVFRQLLAAVEALPDEVLADPQRHMPWLDGRPLTAEAFFAHFHEEHEPDMRAWLARVEQ